MLIKKIFFSLFFIIIGWILAQTYNNFKEEDIIPEVITVLVKRGNLENKVSLTAKVVEREVISITSAANTVIERIYVKPNDWVKKGDILLILRKDELLNSLKKEEFNLEQAQNKQALLKEIENHPEVIERNEEKKNIEWDLQKAGQSLDDTRELYTRKAVAYYEVQEKELEVKRLQMKMEKSLRESKAVVKRLKEEKEELEVTIPAIIYRINELKNQIQNCVILSPINGLVKQIPVEKNKKVEYGTLLLTIGTTDELIAKGNLKESNFFLVKMGQEVKMHSESLGKSYTGTVKKAILSTKGEKQEEGWEVIIQIDNPTGLTAGMNLIAEIVVQKYQKSVVVIPPEALYEEDSVFVVENSHLKKKSIEIGYSTPDQMEVKSGLKEGESVVVQYGEVELKEGMRIKERR